jgi:hypothetical protein
MKKTHPNAHPKTLFSSPKSKLFQWVPRHPSLSYSSSIHPSIHPGGLSLFQWYNQRAQKQNWRRSGLQDLNPVFSRSQSTRVFFFSDKTFVMVFLTPKFFKKRDKILENINCVIVVVFFFSSYINKIPLILIILIWEENYSKIFI